MSYNDKLIAGWSLLRADYRIKNLPTSESVCIGCALGAVEDTVYVVMQCHLTQEIRDYV